MKLADPFLILAAEVLDDLEKARIANENRLRQLTRTGEDADGQERGFGLTLDHPDVARLAAIVDGLAESERRAEANLRRYMRRHPLGLWIQAQKGIGDKQGARLLAAIGDPYWNDLHDRPRTVSELWAYCGLHTVPSNGGPWIAAARKKGERANWSADAKMRVYLIAVSCMKTDGPYRVMYVQAREKYADAVHPLACRRCGPSGKPAEAGTSLSLGHKHARALRLISKAILRDLWCEAHRLHTKGAE